MSLQNVLPGKPNWRGHWCLINWAISNSTPNPYSIPMVFLKQLNIFDTEFVILSKSFFLCKSTKEHLRMFPCLLSQSVFTFLIIWWLHWQKHLCKILSQGNLTEGEGSHNIVDLLVLTSLDQLPYLLKILFMLLTKWVTLMGRSTVLSFPFQLVLPGCPY